MQFIKILFTSTFCVFLCKGNPPGVRGHLKHSCSELKAGQKGFLQLTKPDEPGEPLTVYGKVVDQRTGTAVSGASLFFYQTDASGIYNPNGGADQDARIKGTVLANENGCYKIRTILPGDYPGQKNSRHLHYIITAEGYKEIKSILFFKGFTTPNLSTGETLKVLDIRKDDSSGWLATIDLKIERPDE